MRLFSQAGLQPLSSTAAFMVPGLALWVHSGYSWGALLLLVCSMASVPLWLRSRPERSTGWLAGAMVAMALLWMLDLADVPTWGVMDRPSKYLLALPCLFYLAVFPPQTRWLWWGLAVGAWGSGLVALRQTQWQGLERATGYTNAIQYGDLSLLLALMCLAVLLVQWTRWSLWQRLAWVSSVGMGLLGSLLSGSRGGWLALGLSLPVLVALQAWCGQRRRALLGAALVLAGTVALIGFGSADMRARLDKASQEVADYQNKGDAASSVGQRLDHWKLAWAMGLDRPLTGWGRQGYETEKARRVAAGQAHPFVLQFGHAHNEVLDLFAKRGLPGVAVLLFFYGVPLLLFWPTPRRVRRPNGQIDEEMLGLCLVGVLLPVTYIGFGLTQVFLAHNSGNMFYLFMCMLVHALLLSHAHSNGPSRPSPLTS